MSTPSRAPRGLTTWVRFLEAHSAISRELERDLVPHGLTLSDYDVLVQLRSGPRRGLRPVEISRAVLLTRSGMTRLVAGLERAGLVESIACPEDRRGTYVRLTAAGKESLRRASHTHRARIDELFGARFDDKELTTLLSLMEKLPHPERQPTMAGA